MRMRRRRLILTMLALPGLAGSLRAATFGDWTQSIGVVSLFLKAGIPIHNYRMSTGSMLPTLNRDDVLLADLRLAGQQPARGDIIVFLLDGDPSTVWLKRVIGLPGDRVAFHGGKLILNGVPVAQTPAGPYRDDSDQSGQGAFETFVEALPDVEPYTIMRKIKGDGLLDDVIVRQVEPGFLYVVGDNRDNSMDSRVDTMKPVAIANVVGRIVYRERPKAGWLVPRERVRDLPSE